MTDFQLPRLESSTDSIRMDVFSAIHTKHGNLPLTRLAYHTSVSGLAVRTRIFQTFYNPLDEAIEATYLFPIAGDQAVVDAVMWADGRCVRCELKERRQARRTYENALRQGHRAALLEENRPETFSMRVGNLPAGEAVQMQIETVGKLPVTDSQWTLRLPLVVAPKYTSGLALPSSFPWGHSDSTPHDESHRRSNTNRSSAGNGVAGDTDRVPDASSVTPPIRIAGWNHPIQLAIETHLDLRSLSENDDYARHIQSSLHSIALQSNPENQTCRIVLAGEDAVDRDFILRGKFAKNRTNIAMTVQPPTSARQDQEIEKPSEETTFAIDLVAPPVDAQSPRDVIFVLDRSGSMCGWKMQAARRGIIRLIDSLSDHDRFQIVVFDCSVDSYRGSESPWIPATSDNRLEATRYLAQIDARGGTEMADALTEALAGLHSNEDQETRVFRNPSTDTASSEPTRGLALVLVTDGQITGEDDVLQTLGHIPAHQRPQFLCLGIDRCVNASVLQRLAHLTGGCVEIVESSSRLDDVFERFSGSIGRPALVDLEIIDANNPSRSLQLSPPGLTVLYEGRSATVFGRHRSTAPTLMVRGTTAAGKPFQRLVDASAIRQPKERPMLPALWGLGHVRFLEDQYAVAGNPDQDLRSSIIDTSLRCHVLSRFTAMVAVDQQEVVTEGTPPLQIRQPVDLPEGWAPYLPPIAPESRITSRCVAKDRIVPRKDAGSKQPNAAAASVPPQSTAPRNLPNTVLSYLVSQGICSEEQIEDAARIASSTQCGIDNALKTMGYAEEAELISALAAIANVTTFDLKHEIDESIIELIPESVARENQVIPVDVGPNGLTLAISDPFDIEVVEKLRFILNQRIEIVLAPVDEITEAINHYYGMFDGESAESMLQEFTDTAIDFTETESASSPIASPSAEPFGFEFDDANVVCQSQARWEEDLDVEMLSAPAPPPQSMMKPSRQRRDAKMPPEALAENDSVAAAKSVAKIIQEMIQQQASHVMIEGDPDQSSARFGYGINGSMTWRDDIPATVFLGVVKRIKVLSKLSLEGNSRFVRGQIDLTVGDVRVRLDVEIYHAPDQSITVVLSNPAMSAETIPPEIAKVRATRGR